MRIHSRGAISTGVIAVALVFAAAGHAVSNGAQASATHSAAQAGVLAGVFLPSGGASTTAADATSRVTVKASEFKFVFSKRSVPTGTVIFTVVNKGKLSHNFKIAGKKTRVLLPGKSQTLRVTIAKKGRYAFLCTLVGHAAAGMKGKYAVGMAPVAAPPAPAPQTTNVTVSMFEMGFKLSTTVVPRGTVIFKVVNDGKVPHDFRIERQGTEYLDSGQSETLTVGLAKPGQFTFLCTVSGHAGAGMIGTLTVK